MKRANGMKGASQAQREGRSKRTIGRLGIAALLAAAGLAASTGVANAGFQSSLTLNTPAGLSAATWTPSLGDTVTFTAVLAKTVKNPVLIVDCFQNQVLVYEQRGLPTGSYELGGTSSAWLTNGGAASCTANVYDLVTKGGTTWYMAQAVTTFQAAG